MALSPLRVVVRTSNAAHEDLGVPPLPRGATVAALKKHLTHSHPAHPRPTEQRIVCGGRMLEDSELLVQALRKSKPEKDDVDDTVVVHLVLDAAAISRGSSACASPATAAAPSSPKTPIGTRSAQSQLRRRHVATAPMTRRDTPGSQAASSQAQSPAPTPVTPQHQYMVVPPSPNTAAAMSPAALAAMQQQYYAAYHWQTMMAAAAAASPRSPLVAGSPQNMGAVNQARASQMAAAAAAAAAAVAAGGSPQAAPASQQQQQQHAAAMAAYRAWYASVVGAVAAGSGFASPSVPAPAAAPAVAQMATGGGGVAGGPGAAPHPAPAPAVGADVPPANDAPGVIAANQGAEGPVANEGNGGRFAQAGLGAVPMMDAGEDARGARPQNLLGVVYLVCKLLVLVAVFGQGASEEKLMWLISGAFVLFLFQIGFFSALARLAGLRRRADPAAANAAPVARPADGQGDAGNDANAEEEEEEEEEDHDEPQSAVEELVTILYAFVTSLWPQRPEPLRA